MFFFYQRKQICSKSFVKNNKQKLATKVLVKEEEKIVQKIVKVKRGVSFVKKKKKKGKIKFW